MTLKHLEEYRDPEIARTLIDSIQNRSRKNIRLMEVCGTHTVSIFRHGIRDVLPDTISLLSGPGCPVCVTAQGEIDAFIALSRVEGMIITTFGDLIRVPGTKSSLQEERATGRDIRMVYSAMDALEVAQANPDRQVVFLGVGFETTAPHYCRDTDDGQNHGPAEFLRHFSPQTGTAGPGRPHADRGC